jgi:hypothetical protein
MEGWNWLNSLLPPDLGPQLQQTLYVVSRGLLLLILAGLVALAGWLLATLLARAARAIVSWTGADTPVRRLSAGSMRDELLPSRVASYTVFWCVLLVGSVLALRIVGIDLVPSIALRLQDIVPRVVTSALVLVIGIPVALAASRLLNAILEPSGMRRGRIRSQAVVALLVGFTILLALDQLGFAAQFVLAVGIAAVAAAGLALALAFGLGCRELARDLIVEYLRASEDERGHGRS